MNERERLEQEIRNLECDLRASDYEVIKAYEYSICGIDISRWQGKPDFVYLLRHALSLKE